MRCEACDPVQVGEAMTEKPPVPSDEALQDLYYDLNRDPPGLAHSLRAVWLAGYHARRRLERVRATDAEIALNEARTLISLQRAQIEQDLRAEKQMREKISRLEEEVAELREKEQG
jgi:hypothetical protein